MRLVAVQERVYRPSDISGSRRRAHASREPDQKETWLLMAIGDPMERGTAAALSFIPSGCDPFTLSRGDH